MKARCRVIFRVLVCVLVVSAAAWAPAAAAQPADLSEFEVRVDDNLARLDFHLEGAFSEEFVDQVVPVLQRRGRFRREYEGTTLRDHLGLPRPRQGLPAPAGS